MSAPAQAAFEGEQPGQEPDGQRREHASDLRVPHGPSPLRRNGIRIGTGVDRWEPPAGPGCRGHTVPLTRAMIERLPGLKFISQTGRNTNHLDVPACTQHGITCFDPVVPNWNDEAMNREVEALRTARIIVMAITADTAGIASLAESGWAALSALARRQAFGLYVDNMFVAEGFNPRVSQDSSSLIEYLFGKDADQNPTEYGSQVRLDLQECQLVLGLASAHALRRSYCRGEAMRRATFC